MRTGGSAQVNASVTVQTVNLNSVRVKILGQFRIALIDTGCGTSIISHQFLRKCGLSMSKLAVGQNFLMFAANGSRINVLGRVTILLNLGGG